MAEPKKQKSSGAIATFADGSRHRVRNVWWDLICVLQTKTPEAEPKAAILREAKAKAKAKGTPKQSTHRAKRISARSRAQAADVEDQNASMGYGMYEDEQATHDMRNPCNTT